MEELRAWAAQDLRSLNGHIEFLLREAVRARRGKKARSRGARAMAAGAARARRLWRGDRPAPERRSR